MDKSKKNIGAIIGEYGAFIALALLVIIISCVSPEFRTASKEYYESIKHRFIKY